jgi:hypothetical protein
MGINPNLIEIREREIESECIIIPFYDDVKNVEGGNKNTQ